MTNQHPYKKGQLVSYHKDGHIFVDRVSDVGRTWIELRDERDLMYPSDMIDILEDVPPTRVYTNSHTAPYTAPTTRIERSTGAPDAELDTAHRALMIDYALDTGDKALFMQLTTPTHVGSVV